MRGVADGAAVDTQVQAVRSPLPAALAVAHFCAAYVVCCRKCGAALNGLRRCVALARSSTPGCISRLISNLQRRRTATVGRGVGGFARRATVNSQMRCLRRGRRDCASKG